MSVISGGLRLRGARKGDDRGTSVGENVRPGAVREDRGYGWSAYHDVPLGSADADTVDEVIIGPGGIFVVEHAETDDSVVVEGGSLRRNGAEADELAADVRAAAGILEAELPPHVRALVQPVLCLDTTSTAFGWSGDVMVCCPVTLAPMMNSRPPLVTDTRVQEIAEHLERRYPYEEESAELDVDPALLTTESFGEDSAEVEAFLQTMRDADLAQRAEVIAQAEEALLGVPELETVETVETQDDAMAAPEVETCEPEVEVSEVEVSEAPVEDVQPTVRPTKGKRVAPKRRKEPTLGQRVLPVAVLLVLVLLMVLAGLWIL